MLIMKKGIRQIAEGIELRNQGKNRTREENRTYKYLGILEADHINQVEMKPKKKKKKLKISQRNKKTTRNQTTYT